MVAPSPRWSGKSIPLRLGLKSCAVSTLVPKVAPCPLWSRGIVSWFLVAPSPPRSGKLRRLRQSLESRAVCALVCALVCTLIDQFAQHPTRSQELFLSRAVSTSVWKVWKWLSLVAPVTLFPDRQDLGVFAMVWKIRPYPSWSRGIDYWSRRLRNGLENQTASVLV